MESTSGADADRPKQSRACESCYRAKAKCIPQEGRENDKCSRCQRLQKACARPTQKPRKKRGPNVSASTAQLEKKIESLVNFLSTGRAPVAPIVESRSDIYVLAATKPDIGCLQDVPESSSDAAATPAVAAATGNSDHGCCAAGRYAGCGIAALTPAGSVTSDLDCREERGEKLLKVYRERFAVHIPVEFVSPQESAQELQAKRPWLFRAVMIVACQDERSRQLEQSIQIARDFADAMLIRGERSLDLLQALLVYNTWAIHYSPGTPYNMTAGYMQLAIAMVVDLGLNRPARQDDIGGADIERWALNEHLQNDLKRTPDERRAFLYCYLLTSTSSQCVKKIEAFHITPYLEHSIQVHIDSAQSDLDLVLANSVKLQAFTEDINRATAERADPRTSKAPIWMHIPSAKMTLQGITATVPTSVRHNTQLCLRHRCTEIFLYDSCVQKQLFSEASSSQRLDMLYACLLAAKSFLDQTLEQPESNFLGYSVINCSQIGHALSTMIKLSFVQEEGWNLPNVRETINLQAYFNRIIINFERAGEVLDKMQQTPCRPSFPTGCSRAMRRVLASCEARLAAESEPVGFQGQQGYTPLDDPLLNMSYGQFDDAYWDAIISDLHNGWENDGAAA